jgi:hypothetical protein
LYLQTVQIITFFKREPADPSQQCKRASNSIQDPPPRCILTIFKLKFGGGNLLSPTMTSPLIVGPFLTKTLFIRVTPIVSSRMLWWIWQKLKFSLILNQPLNSNTCYDTFLVPKIHTKVFKKKKGFVESIYLLLILYLGMILTTTYVSKVLILLHLDSFRSWYIFPTTLIHVYAATSISKVLFWFYYDVLILFDSISQVLNARGETIQQLRL